MLKFSEYRYERPDRDAVTSAFKEKISAIRNAASLEEQLDAISAVNKLRSEIDSMFQLVYIRHSVNTNDEFYKAEQDYADETGPIIQEYVTDYYRAITESVYRDGLEERFGTQLLRSAELALKTFKPEIIEDLQLENKLTTEYGQLIASAKIQFDGEERTLSQLTPYTQSTDRDVRRSASEAVFGFLSGNEQELDLLYDKLVKIRTAIAHKLGYPNYVQLGYDRLGRTDYDADMVANFRKQVREQIVPIAVRLAERQQARIGVDKLHYYDENFSFKSGNATPKGDPDWILEQGRRMYREMSPELDEFFQFMSEHELLDLLSRKGKESGGYCTYISEYESPFIFANFNGTSGDVDVLTHEAGHAFQVYMSRGHDVPEYFWPTMEAAEIHSMSMEFLAWPWMELFFKEDTDKYRFDHLASALMFIPYGVSVDEFQHFVYENPEASPAERKAKWREIEKVYRPYRSFDGNDFLERGGTWQKQSHIYQAPFYYIDYTLAQLCAFQFWKRSRENFDQAWQDYLALCRLGGSQSFTALARSAGLMSPFEDGAVTSVVGEIRSWLDSVDDSSF
ncbi:M3 family oligoendopeptidase [Paenibacillus pasadenensis]|uniref:M3 family oligoendopeptidase n=1 Tax=Paenibacillus pasadenensis TaxID=217090 RepID=UPI00203F4E4E|nr:M3 family oligoendopeptidase [Paenibacillus pasadenensis]MCM3748516.1 M3 family oligoendopeptidase [Paenibacillus pasadenensis]